MFFNLHHKTICICCCFIIVLYCTGVMFKFKKMSLATNPKEMVEYIRSLGVGLRPIGDPFFEEGDAVCGLYTRYGILDMDDDEPPQHLVKKFKCEVPFCNLEFESVVSYELHYNSAHRYGCAQCKKQLPSPHLLHLHLSETHDSFFRAAAEKRPMYACFVESCPVVCKEPKERRAHCIEAHSYPHDFRFDISSRKPKSKKQPAKKNVKEEEKVGVEDKGCSSFTFGHRSYKFGLGINKSCIKKEETNIEMQELMETLPSTSGV